MRRNAPKAHPEQVPADGKSRKRRAAGNRLRRKTAPGEGHRNRGLGKGKGMKARMKAGAEIHGRTYEYLKDSGAPGRESGRVITNPAAPWLMPQHTGSGGDAMAKSVEQYLEYEKEISPLITANDKEIACINAAVHALSDPMEREVLRLRYLDGDGDSYRLMRWREVAIRIYGDDDAKDIISAQRLHDKALLEIDFV